MKRILHGTKLSPPSPLMKKNVVPYTRYIAWYFLDNWFPTVIRPLYLKYKFYIK